MDNESKEFIKTVLAAVALLVTIAASAGSISFGAKKPDVFYIIVGVVNLLGWGGLVVYQFVKNLKENRK